MPLSTGHDRVARRGLRGRIAWVLLLVATVVSGCSQPEPSASGQPVPGLAPAANGAPAASGIAASPAAASQTPAPAATASATPAPATPRSPAGAPLPPLPQTAYGGVRPMNVLEDVHTFAAQHPEVLDYVPCFCGCENAGHRGNTDCFVQRRAPSGEVLAWEPHGAT
jgi:hypothetical protein